MSITKLSAIPALFQQGYLDYVTNINDVGIRRRFDKNPLAIAFPLHLEASDIILSKNCQCPGILVPAYPQSQIRNRAWRIVIQPDEACLSFEKTLQPLSLQP